MRRFDRFIGELGPGGCHAVRSSLPSRLRRRIGHSWPIVTVNSFLEDTCVLVATAYLLVRGPFERVFASPIVSGLIFGAAGASEAVFPSARFPYASHTLACACATAFVSWPAGAIAALITISAGFLLRSPQTALAMSIQVAVTVPILAVVPKATARHIALPALAAGIAQALGVLAAHGISSTQASVRSPWTLPANAFGVVLLWVVVRDAQVRAEAEVHRREVGEARRLATEAQLKALRSRVQPHFLYNALGSIAALCNSAPDRASRAVIRLGGLMRQALEADFSKPHTLAKEIEAVKGYVEIERERYGARLSVEYRIEGCEQLLVPVFGVQVLVENAIHHGVSQALEGGCVSVVAKRGKGYALVAVADNGVGLPKTGWRRDSDHGLGILARQLEALSGAGSRLRVLRRPVRGTLAVMRIPSGGAV